MLWIWWKFLFLPLRALFLRRSEEIFIYFRHQTRLFLRVRRSSSVLGDRSQSRIQSDYKLNINKSEGKWGGEGDCKALENETMKETLCSLIMKIIFCCETEQIKLHFVVNKLYFWTLNLFYFKDTSCVNVINLMTAGQVEQFMNYSSSL